MGNYFFYLHSNPGSFSGMKTHFVKRGCIALLILLIVISVTGCSKESPPKDNGQTEEEASLAQEKSSYTSSDAVKVNTKLYNSSIRLPQLDDDDHNRPRAVIETTMGDIELILYSDLAPKTVESFIRHAESGYYTGLTFNKVIDDFIIEGGDPDGKGGKSAFEDSPYLEQEFSVNLWHFRGAVSMSEIYGQEGNGSRFFIVQSSYVDDETLQTMKNISYPQKVWDTYSELGGTPGFDWKRTVFASVTDESMAVVDAIASSPIDMDRKPLETILIEGIKIYDN